jgi:hypothetical protein|tara:strand:- start:401 stop:610 length:210 start_codon:yes stop_codon:yes gene_type:complete
MITKDENGAETRSEYLLRVTLAFFRKHHWDFGDDSDFEIDYDGETLDYANLMKDIEEAILEGSLPNGES